MPARLLSAFSLVVILSLLSGVALKATGQNKSTAPAVMPERKLFTLHSSKVMLSQALGELAKQTGIRVEAARGEPDRVIALDLKQVSFWQALDAIAAAGNARVNLYPTSNRIVLEKRGDAYRLPPISYDGRFRMSIKKVTATRDLEIRDNDPNRSTYNLTVEVAWDPELQPLFLETRPHKVRLVDDKNNTLAVPDDGSSLAPVDGHIALLIDLRLPALPRSVGEIRTLEGELSMIGPSKMLTFHFDTLDKLAKLGSQDPERRLTQEGVTCHISKLTLDRDRWTVRVALDYPPGMKQLDSNQSWVVNNEMILESADGKRRLTTGEYVLVSSTPRRAVLSYHFRDKDEIKRGKPAEWKVSYRTPANLIEMPIKFAFKNVPLP
jgi:hypothetical protein